MSSAQEFLKTEFEKRKKQNPSFSLRAFSKWLNVSPAQVSQMLAGKRTITPETLNKIALRVGSSPLERNDLLSTLVSSLVVEHNPKALERKLLAEDQFRLIADWYHMAILSLTKLKGSKPDPRWIARRLGISAEEANLALSRLVRMKLLETRPKFRQIAEPFEVSSQVPSEAIRRYHKQSLNLAAEKLETVPVELRQFQSISIPLKSSNVPEFKKLIDGFLDRAANVAESKPAGAATEIYNLNVQLFPLTHTLENS